VLLDVMATNPRVASHVHTLIVDMTEDRDADPNHPEPEAQDHTPSTCSVAHGRACFEQWMHSLDDALDNMPKLRALKIFPDFMHDAATSAWPLRHCAGRLRELRCGFAWDEELIGFLSTQPDIVDLCLEHDLDPASQTIPDSLVPKLSIFEGMPSTASKICPGRPLTHLSIWLDDNTNLSALIPQLGLSTKPILSLELGDYNMVSVSELILVGAHIHLPELRFLGPCMITPWDVRHSPCLDICFASYS
jgi:hypothetical protein